MAKPSSVAHGRRLPSRAKSTPRAHERQVTETLETLDQLNTKMPSAVKVIALLRTWLSDRSGYDEEAWPALKKSLNRERTRVGARRLFDE